MPETRIIPTNTTVTVSGATVQIFTEYDPNAGAEPFLVNAFIADAAGSTDSVIFSEGDLVFQNDGTPQQFTAEINNQGELVIISEKANFYSIDQSTGELIYNEP